MPYTRSLIVVRCADHTTRTNSTDDPRSGPSRLHALRARRVIISRRPDIVTRRTSTGEAVSDYGDKLTAQRSSKMSQATQEHAVGGAVEAAGGMSSSEPAASSATPSTPASDPSAFHLLYAKSKVYVHPTPYSRDNIAGYVAVLRKGPKQPRADGGNVYLAFMPEDLLKEREELSQWVEVECRAGGEPSQRELSSTGQGAGGSGELARRRHSADDRAHLRKHQQAHDSTHR